MTAATPTPRTNCLLSRVLRSQCVDAGPSRCPSSGTWCVTRLEHSGALVVGLRATLCHEFPSHLSVTPPLLPFELPDGALIRRFLDGDERAFRMLYERHTPRLKMTLQRLLGARRQDVEDVLQDTWLAGCRGLHGYRGDAKFSTWLTSIGVRTTLNHLERRADRDTDITDDLPAPLTNGPATAIDLERALAALPDHQRIVVVLHDVEGFTHEEIGAQLGMAAGTSKATLSRARQILRSALSEGVSNASR